MNKLNKIWNSICKFFRQIFTKEGREEKYYSQALKNMQGKPETMEKFNKRMLQRHINEFLNQDKNIRILTPDQKIALVKDRFGKAMKQFGLTICPETQKLIDA